MLKSALFIAIFAILIGAVPAMSYHPEEREMERVKIEAHKIDETARELYSNAYRGRYHWDHSEPFTLGELYALKDAASHFHRQVERYNQDSRHTSRDYENLVRAFYRARSTMKYLRAYHFVEREFSTIEWSLRSLERYYGRGHPYYHPRSHSYRPHRHGYGRDHHRSCRRHHHPHFYFRWQFGH